MYAIVKTGGKQYRVEQGTSLLVERLRADEGAKVSLEPLLYVDGSKVLDAGDDLSKVSVEAKVLGHERGPKLRVVKFKPKRGYKRRNGHRQELTRIEVTGLKGPAARSSSKSAAAATTAERSGEAADKPAPKRRAPAAKATEKPKAGAGEKPAAEAAEKPKAEAAEKPASRGRASSKASADKPAIGRAASSKASADKPATGQRSGSKSSDKPAPRRRATPKKEDSDGS